MAFLLTLDEDRGFLNCSYQTRHGEGAKLIDVKAGGGFNVPRTDNLEEAAYYMYGQNVAKNFVALSVQNWDTARPWVNEALAQYGGHVGEYVFHQASKPAIKATLALRPEINPELVHTIMEDHGNPAVVSGPLVLHHALTKRNHEPGTLIPVMLLGAGNGGALYGAALYRV